jgi:hypothetical protein
VVAAVNYHGSSSFGYAFKDSITAAGARWNCRTSRPAPTGCCKQRWADPKRLFATGGSYGGYMVAWMNGHCPPGRYRAYVCHAGCFDWTAMFADDAWAWHARRSWAPGTGTTWPRCTAQSPHAFAANMHTPTLVIHGALDYRVPDAQGLAYYNTLKARGVDARLLWFPDENHWILKPRNSRTPLRPWYACRRSKCSHQHRVGRSGLAPPMLIDFFYTLRAAKLPVSVKEYLTLLEALQRRRDRRRRRPDGGQVLLPGAHHAGQGRSPLRQVRPRLRRLLQGRGDAHRLHQDMPLEWLRKVLEKELSPRRRPRSRRWAGTS